MQKLDNTFWKGEVSNPAILSTPKGDSTSLHHPFMSDDRLRRVKAMADLRFPQRISLACAARAAGLEEHYFSTYFRRRTRQTFSQWRRMQRVHRALTLMGVGTINLTGIAVRVGYSDLTGLERAFKATLGTTPRQLRLQLRKLRGG